MLQQWWALTNRVRSSHASMGWAVWVPAKMQSMLGRGFHNIMYTRYIINKVPWYDVFHLDFIWSQHSSLHTCKGHNDHPPTISPKHYFWLITLWLADGMLITSYCTQVLCCLILDLSLCYVLESRVKSSATITRYTIVLNTLRIDCGVLFHLEALYDLT